jgi:hypothetical protein
MLTARQAVIIWAVNVSDVIRGIDANGVSFFDQPGASLDLNPFREYSTEII